MATDTPLITAPDDALYEVVGGRIVEKPPMGSYETDIATFLIGVLVPFVRERRLGRIMGETLFRLNAIKDLQRRPDIAFVSHERWPSHRRAPDCAIWDMVPDLAIEIVSPTNTANEVVDKVVEYFEAGVRGVWVIYPRRRQVYVYESPQSVHILALNAVLDGAPLLPGFQLPLTTLFEDEPA